MNQFVVSARKYRPATFDTVVGQAHITTTLKNAIRNNHLAQAFLFCGPRGVGKTTCARILAKTLNCRNLSDKTEACNECESCQSFNNGQSLNIYELDAASNNSVDDIRALVEQVRYAPHAGQYKIYIIDEVHMLSSGAFNAFLKTLEEPPSYAVFILATTEKHKIIPTIISRCQIFDFNRIQVDDIANHLAYVAQKEGVNAEPDALHIIAQKADGALRDALSIFDQIVSFAGTTVTYKDVINNLSILDYDYFFKLTDDISKGNISSVLVTFNELLAEGFEGHHFINGLASHFRDVLVSSDPATLILLEVSKNIRDRYKQQAQQVPSSLLLRLLDVCSQCDVSYRAARNQRLHVELALIKMCSLNSAREIKNETTANIPLGKNPVTHLPIAEKKNSEPVKSTSLEKKTEVPVQVVAPTAPVSKNEPSKNYSSLLSATSLASIQTSVVNESTTPVTVKTDEQVPSDNVSQEKLSTAWNTFAQKEKSDGKHQLYATLTHHTPQLVDNNTITLEVINLAQENLLNEEKQALMDYLRKELNNYKLQLKTIVREMEAGDPVPYTTRDKYLKMVEKNPMLEDMRKQLGLELDS